MGPGRGSHTARGLHLRFLSLGHHRRHYRFRRGFQRVSRRKCRDPVPFRDRQEYFGKTGDREITPRSHCFNKEWVWKEANVAALLENPRFSTALLDGEPAAVPRPLPRVRFLLLKTKVGVEGIEPSTSILSVWRSTTELHTRYRRDPA